MTLKSHSTKSSVGRYAGVTVLALLLTLLAACGGNSSAGEAGHVVTVKWAYPAPVSSLLPLYVAGENPAICKPLGIRVKPVAVDPAGLITGVASGSVQMSENGLTGTLAAAENSPATIQMIALTGPQAQTIYAKPSIRSVGDLKGKVMGVSAPGATSDNYARSVLLEAGLTPDKDVKFVYTKISSASIAQAAAGNIDALPIAPPIPAELIRAGFKEVPGTALKAGTPSALVQGHAIGVSPRYASAHKDVVTKSLKCLQAAIDWIPSHKAERDAALVKYTGIAETAAEDAYESNKITFEDGLQPATAETINKIIDTLVSLGTFSRDKFPLGGDKLVNDSYLK
jgi:ABC-type nitrate/sulfonate/bicarbonate transport system substrate-binding protein